MDIFDKCYTFDAAKEAKEKGLYPYFIPIQESRGTRVVIEGKELIMAGSNNYLGLSWDPRVKEAAIEATRKWGTSCSGSRFLNGTLALHEELEARLAQFVGRQSALCFTTGYQTNLGAISALVGKDEHIFSDKLNHASIMDGIFLAAGMRGKVRVHRYLHNNMESLEKFLAEEPMDAPKLVVTDGVFSMEGDIVKLPRLKELCTKYSARLYLDEAHGLGVLGNTGRGTEEHYGVKSHADIIMCTFSKSFGVPGRVRRRGRRRHRLHQALGAAADLQREHAAGDDRLGRRVPGDHREGARARAAAAGHRPQDGGRVTSRWGSTSALRRRPSCRSSSGTWRRRSCSGARCSTAACSPTPCSAPPCRPTAR